MLFNLTLWCQQLDSREQTQFASSLTRYEIVELFQMWSLLMEDHWWVQKLECRYSPNTASMGCYKISNWIIGPGTTIDIYEPTRSFHLFYHPQWEPERKSEWILRSGKFNFFYFFLRISNVNFNLFLSSSFRIVLYLYTSLYCTVLK